MHHRSPPVWAVRHRLLTGGTCWTTSCCSSGPWAGGRCWSPCCRCAALPDTRATTRPPTPALPMLKRGRVIDQMRPLSVQPSSSSPTAATQLPATRTTCRAQRRCSISTSAEPRATSTKTAAAMPASPNTEQQQRHRGDACRPAVSDAMEAGKAPTEPGERQHEQSQAPRHRTVQPCQQRHRQRGQQVLKADKQMRDPVVDRAQPRRCQVRLHGRRRQQQRRSRHERRTADHSARHRKMTPASVTTAPAACNAMRPVRKRCMRPMTMPAACRLPVATTKPAL